MFGAKHVRREVLCETSLGVPDFVCKEYSVEISRLFIIALVLLCTDLSAELKLSEVFTENMVVQQGKPLRIFGISDPGSRVKVRLGMKTKTVKTGEDGKWVAELSNLRASTRPLTLTVDAKQKTGMANREYRNIYVGDVWLLAGGANIHMGYKDYPQWSTAVTDIDNEFIRAFGAHPDKSITPKDSFKTSYDFRHKWQVVKEDYAQPISPAAYTFASYLQKKLRSPIGLFKASWSDSKRKSPIIDAWIPTEAFEEAGIDGSKQPSQANMNTPAAAYNAMVHPLRNMSFKGVIWYQGEDDMQKNLANYDKKLKALMKSWRKAFNDEELPFFVVQSSSTKTESWNTMGQARAWLREKQAKAVADDPFASLVVTTDLGEFEDKFPHQKDKIGMRLAMHAMKLKRKSTIASSPYMKKMAIKSYKVTMEFENVGKGLAPMEVVMNKGVGKTIAEDKDAIKIDKDKIYGFTICGPDKVFHPADSVKVSGKRVEIFSKNVRRPVAVRYGWENFVKANLFSKDGLPVTPFRTDDFPMPIFDASLIGKDFIKGKDPAGSALQPVLQVGRNILAKISSEIGDVYRAKPVDKQPHLYSYFKVTNSDFKNGKSPKAVLSIVYYDSGTGEIIVHYDSKDQKVKVGNNKPGAFKLADKISLTGTDKWKVVEIPLKDALFNEQCHTADVRLSRKGGELIIKGVYVRKPDENKTVKK